MGKRRLESAIQSFCSSNDDEVTFDVRWRPFQLSTELPSGKGVNKLAYYHSKFGKERTEAMIPYMKQVAHKEGIDMKYGGYIGNTLDSHRLIWMAQMEGGSKLQDLVVEEIFKAYFEKEQSLGDVSVLKQCAEAAGMSQSSIDTLLSPNSTLGKEETLVEMHDYRTNYKCTGVPFFIFNEGKHTLSGAQPPEELSFVFETLINADDA